MPLHRPRSKLRAVPRHQRAALGNDFLFGVAYYPEHWSPRRWKRDFALMRECGVNVVRMGEFAWDIWEPRPGNYQFDLFDEAIALAARHGIRTILGTPTAGAPRWLTALHPEWLKHTSDGQPIDHPGRLHVGLVHPEFRDVCRNLASALAAHYAANPSILGWQIDNEQHCLCPHDFSPAAGQAFQRWLRVRYRRIERLNVAWGTAFSAQSYDNFEQVPLPLRSRPDRFPPHPGHLLDFQRFTSDTTLAFIREQAWVLRAANRRWCIFHNGLFAHLDYWEMQPQLGALAVDVYPGFGGEGNAQVAWTAFKLEECRACAGSFLVPELESGPAGSTEAVLETPAPSQMRLWAWQCVAHGADAVLHFRWRTCSFGQELYWQGVLDHDGRPRRRHRELCAEGREFARIGPRLIGTVRDVRIGILIDWEQDDAHEAILAAHYPAPRHQAEYLLGALLESHYLAGLVHAKDDFTGLDAIIIPSFGHIRPELATRLATFVRGGGWLFCTAKTGLRDKYNKALLRTPPGPLARLLGARVEESGAFRSPGLSTVILAAGETQIEAPVGYEILATTEASVVARWVQRDPGALAQPHVAMGEPAATCRRYGRGAAVLVGTWVTATNVHTLCAWLATLAGWRSPFDAAPEVGISRRRTHGRSFLLVLNHSPRPQLVRGPLDGHNLITRRHVSASVALPPYGVAVIEERRRRV